MTEVLDFTFGLETASIMLIFYYEYFLQRNGWVKSLQWYIMRFYRFNMFLHLIDREPLLRVSKVFNFLIFYFKNYWPDSE